MSQLFDNRPLDAPVAFAKVALEQGIDLSPGGLTYGVPAALSDLIIGERVSVPLGRGNKAVTGYVMSISETSDLPAEKQHLIKSIVARDESGVTLTADLVELAKWMAGYYCCPLGMVFSTMLPAAVKHGTGRVKREMVGVSSEFRVSSSESGDSSEFRVSSSELKGNETAADQAPPPTRNSELGTRNLPRLTKLQQSILTAVMKQREAGHDFTEIRELADLAGAKTISPVRQLIEKGVLITHTQSAVRAVQEMTPDDNDARMSGAAGLALTPDQAAAVAAIESRLHTGFSVTLLHGVTGSGKTEVYLSAIERMQRSSSEFRVPSSASENHGTAHEADASNSKLETRNSELSALILVPEIALTPQTVSRFQRRFGQVALLHSGLTAAQRHEQWRRIRSGDVRIVVGARSAIFAPLTGIGLIIVDEEHESSYKQDQLPRYHARDVAIKRAHLLNIPILLGSGTPSLESYLNAGGGNSSEFRVPSSELKSNDSSPHLCGSVPSNSELGTRNSKLIPPRYHLLRLPTRVPGLTLPKVEIVDLSEERRKRYEYGGKAGVHLVSLRLEAAIKRTMDQKQQTLVLLNRRGYANYIACPDHKCGWLLKCDYCDVTMVFHKDAKLPAGGYVHCHHCTAKQMLPTQCPLCTKKITVFGLGTQRVEEELERKFPGIRMIRMDSDSMHNAKDYAESLDQFRAGLVDVLLGTQMIAKGLDFPNVRLVGVISADTSLHMPDFRSAERTFQLISQVAGRAGRGSDPGIVIVQTFNPADAAITLASQHDYETFAANELKLRSEMGLPPVTRMARIVVRDKDHVSCFEYAKNLAAHLNESNEQMKLNIRVRGPAPCPIARIAEYHRMQIELIAKDAATLQKLMTALRNARLLKSDNHVAVDVDPVSLM